MSLLNGNNEPFIIAELSANHGGSLETAVETIRAAKRAGADAIKLQTFTPDTLTIDCDNAWFKDLLRGTLWEGNTLYALYSQAYTPWEWHAELFRVAREEGIRCFSSPFDATAVDFLEQFDPPAYKIASFEIRDIPLIEYVASKGRPVILSTGIAGLRDIDLAVQACRSQGNDRIILLKCTSSYPAPFSEANLATIPALRAAFGTEAGLSDHTPGLAAPVVAVTLGATVIEKHFITDRSVGGPDASFSLTEQEFTAMVEAVRQARQAVGNVTFEPTQKARESLRFGRSLFVVKDIQKGERFTTSNVRSIRPAYGLHPQYLGLVLGARAKVSLKRGEPLQLNHCDLPE
jgi:pseudaminic acid synthase